MICLKSMDVLAFFLHVLNFVAPAAFLAPGLVALAWGLGQRGPALVGWPAQMALNFALGCAVLAAALAWEGQDGSMIGYAALGGAMGLGQWALGRGGR